MKYLLEFAVFTDILKTDDDIINRRINQSFNNDEEIIKKGEGVAIRWYDTDLHSIIHKIKTRTRNSFKSTSEFNEFLKKVIGQLFIDHFFEMDKNGRYALHMKERDFYILINILINKIKSEKPSIVIVTINCSTPNDVHKVIEIDDEYFNIND